jgi:hypothetical protein
MATRVLLLTQWFDPEPTFNLETSVGRVRVCGFSVGWQGATTRQAEAWQGGATPPARAKTVQSGA